VLCIVFRASDSTSARDPSAPELVIPFEDKLMVPLAAQVFAEPGLSEADIGELLAAHAEASARLTEFFGTLRNGLPITIFCRTASCKEAFGAPPGAARSQELGFARDGFHAKDGFSKTPVVIVTGPVPRTSSILTHEFVHAEMKAWAPYSATPTWFNEGMATFIANEPDCRSNPPVSDFDVTQLVTVAKWEAHIRTPGVTRRTYCQARDAASLWVTRSADQTSTAAVLRKLLVAVARGASFESASRQTDDTRR